MGNEFKVDELDAARWRQIGGLGPKSIGTAKFGKKFPKNWGMGLALPILELKQGLMPPIVQ